MPVSLAMFDKSYAHIKERLDALALDLDITTFDEDGRFVNNGVAVSAQDVEVDYLWLSSHIHSVGADKIFDLVLQCKSIGVLQTFNAGLDRGFYKTLSDKGVRICNSNAQAVAISEYVMAQVLSIVHPIELQRTQQSDKVWERTPFRELSRMNWLIIGFGPIGQALAKRIKPFGTSISVIRRTPLPSELCDKVGTMADLETYLPEADVIVLACPLNEDTRGFADERFFAAVKQDAILVNIARGPLIDDAAMISALDTGNLATAILDVFYEEPLPKDSPLWSHPKIRLTPHTSFAGAGVQGRWDNLFLENIMHFIKGDTLLFEVNPKDIT